MHPLERAVLEWIATANPSLSSAVQQQTSAASVINREYTNGGGVFVSFSFAEHDESTLPKLPQSRLGQPLILEGPVVESPELELGADAILFVSQTGVIGSLEIQARANDYPFNRQPAEFHLLPQDGNYIDLRDQKVP